MMATFLSCGIISDMNICFVFREYPVLDNTLSTGIGNYIRGVSKILSHSNSVTVITEAYKSLNFSVGKVKVHTLEREKLSPFFNKRIVSWFVYNLKVTICLLKLNKKKPFDIVEFGTYENEGFFFSLISLILNLPITIIGRLHTDTYESFVYNYGKNNIPWSIKIINLFESAFVNLPNVNLVTSTNAHKKKAIKIYHLAKKDIAINPIGVKLPKLLTKVISHNSSKRLNILFVGQTDKRKGILTLIRAIPFVLKEHPKVCFTIVGKGSIDVFPLIHKYVQPNLLKQIHYQGYVENPRLLDYFYQESDICVFPSLYESFGLTIAEAMSYGKAVVATNVGGIPEVISDGLNGILIPANNYLQLAKILLELISDTKKRQKLGNSARLAIKNKFTVEKLAKRTIKLYQLAINKNHEIL